MYKLLFVFIFLIAGTTVAVCQLYAPLVKENAYWDASEGNSQNLYIYDGGYRYFFDGDTLIGNHLYNKLFYHPLIVVYNPSPSFYLDTSITIFKTYIREDTNARKTYILEPWETSEVLMFDFSLNIGDTLNSTYTTDGSPIVVDTITNEVLLNGVIRKKWMFDNGHFYIEGIGSSQGFFSPLFTFFGFWLEMNCVNDNNVLIYGNGCFRILEVEEVNVFETSLRAYPNPVKDRLIVEQEEMDLVECKLFDLYGRMLLQKKIFSKVEEIDLSDFPQGMYILDMGDQGILKILKN
ncbi:T9SS type A sorting domain-containing protein [Aureispira sp. CCB-QB1]|uniref:T9SS type A sorting domain-containing protein n=1 Tax=Aureispira sp. CCB-QB1 TaxID=1313421 RepID=UPI0006967EC1|nr:T9SS type A sorting domain-containing protein [Aureispira sp. CCB-QB1]